jgi:hypothetical protein
MDELKRVSLVAFNDAVYSYDCRMTYGDDACFKAVS